MSNRCVLIMDEDERFVQFVTNSMTPFGFDVQCVDRNPEGIQQIKSFKPNLILISAEQSDKSGLSLCCKTKKAVGKRVPVVLTTATLSKDELELHSKQRLHADTYLFKDNLTPEILVAKIGNLLQLDQMDNFDEVMASIQNVNHMGETELNLGGKKDSDPPWMQELLAETSSKAKLNNTKISEQSFTADDSDNYMTADIRKRLVEQEKEISYLRYELKEAKRDARSSPFSSDFLNIREDAAQKDKQIVHLSEKIAASQQTNIDNEEKLRELAERVNTLRKESEKLREKEKDLTIRHEVAQTELVKLNALYEDKCKEFDDHINSFQTQLNDAIAVKEKEFQKTFEELEDNLELENQQALEDLEAEIRDELTNEHNAVLTNIREANAEELAKQNKIFEEAREHFESLISDLEADHQTELKNYDQQAADQTADALKKAESDFQVELDKLSQAHAAESKRLNKEIEALQSGQNDQLEAAEAKHQVRLAEYEQELRKEITTVQQQAAEEKAEALKDAHDEFQEKIKELEEKHAAIFLEKERKLEVELNKAQKQLDLEKANATTTAKDQHKKEIDSICKKYEKRTAELTDKHSKEISRLTQSLEKERQQNANRMQAQKSKHQKEIEQKDQQLENTIKKIEKKFIKAKNIAATSVEAQYKQETDTLRQKHDDQIAELTEKHTVEIKKLQTELKQAQKTAQDQHTRISTEQHQKELQEIEQKLQKETKDLTSKMEGMRKEKSAEIESIKQRAIDELRKVKEKLMNEKKAHEATRHELESKIAQFLSK